MKKLFYLSMVAMLVAFTSCLKDDFASENSGNEQNVKLSINIPQKNTDSRAAHSNPALTDMRLFLYVMYDGKIVSTVNDGSTKVDLSSGYDKDIRLMAGRQYRIVAWADFGSDYYQLTTSKNDEDEDKDVISVAMANTTITGSDNKRDAYFYSETFTLTSDQNSVDVKMKRPFGLVKINTLDYNEGTITDEYKPAFYSTEFTNVPTAFDLLTGVANTEGDITISSTDANIANFETGELSFDYLFANDSQENLETFTVTYSNSSKQDITSYTFENIPFCRNYITNVSGNILTKQGTLNITIEKDWTDFTESVAPGNLQSTLNGLETTDVIEANIVVTGKLPAGTSYTLPALTEGSSLNITLAGAEGSSSITFEEEEFKGILNISNEGDAMGIIINVPNGDATIGSGSWNSMEVTTKENTCIIEEDVEIETLTVNGGNVKIYGIVNSINNTGDGTIYRCLSTQKSLENLLSNTINFDQLIIEKDANIEGNGETIKYPIEIKSNATISNLIFKPETLTQDVVTITGENNTVTFNGCEVYQLRKGDSTSSSAGIVVSGTKQNVTFNNSYIIMESTFYIQRGLNISKATDATVTLDNTRISTSKEKLPDVYTDEMITEFKKGYDSRGISFFNNKGVTTLNINNGSVVERAFYALNWAGTSEKVIVNVDGSQLDGRAAFNINTGVNEIYVKNNSKLIGRNYFTGPTENFAVIVYGYNCEGSKVSVENSEIISHNSPQVQTNYEYSASLRDQNLELSIKDSKLIEYPIDGVQPRMNYFILDDYPGSNTINISNVTVVGKEGAIVLPQEVWDGERKTEPAITNVSDGTNSYKCYKIIEPSDLAWFADKVNSGDVAEDIDGLYFPRDIDLGGHEWTPIGYSRDNSFKGIVFGNLSTVKNLKIEGAEPEEAAGLFGVVNGTIMQLNIENASIKHVVDGNNGGVGVVAGAIYPSGSIEGVKVKNATIESNRWTGGIAGYIYGSVNGCTVENITLTATPDELSGSFDNGDKVGGIVGYSAADNNGTISGNKANNVTIKGYRDLGGIVGAAAATKVTENSVTNINITVDQKTGNYGEETPNAGYIIGRILDSGSIDKSNTENGTNSIETL